MSQRVFQIAAGYEDCNDCNDLREDMIFKMCAGRLHQSDNDLASQPTMSRLENTVTKTDLLRLGECLVDVFVNSYSKALSFRPKVNSAGRILEQNKGINRKVIYLKLNRKTNSE